MEPELPQAEGAGETAPPPIVIQHPGGALVRDRLSGLLVPITAEQADELRRAAAQSSADAPEPTAP